MIAEYECDGLVEFDYRIQTSDEKPFERAVLVKLDNLYLLAVGFDGVDISEQIHIIWYAQLIRIFCRTAVFLIYFFNRLFADHNR